MLGVIVVVILEIGLKRKSERGLLEYWIFLFLDLGTENTSTPSIHYAVHWQ